MPEPRKEIDQLVEQLQHWQQEYYIVARPSATDAEYDRAFDRLVRLEEQYPDLQRPDSPTLRVGSDLSTDLPEVEHSIPVLSLDKAYAADEVTAWAARTEKAVDTPLSFVIEEKIDGASIVLYYKDGVLERGVTRGNGFTGNDVTANIRTIRSVPLRLAEKITLTVRGEVYLPLSRFEAINADQETIFANPRNLAAGSLRRKKSSEVADLPLATFVYEGFFPAEPVRSFDSHQQMLDFLVQLGFAVNPRLGLFGPGRKSGTLTTGSGLRFSTGSLEDVGDFLDRMSAERQGLDYEIDGLVIKVDELEARARLGYTGHHPRWALAFKFESPEAVSSVISIDVQVGRTGRITPVARIEPVRIGGSTVANVTLHNQQYIDALELAPGDQVAVSKRGDVIPAVERVIEKGENADPVWIMPQECPSCGEPLSLRGAHHFCTNRHCPDQVQGRINFFVARDQMDIDNFGPETAAYLIDNNFISSIEDIYSFDPAQLEGHPGFGAKKINLIRNGIEASRSRPYRRLLPAIGIPDLGQKVTELLIEAGYSSIDDLLALADRGGEEELAEIHGIGEKTAVSILESLREPALRQQIAELKAAGLNFAAEPEEPSDREQIFAGQVWCVTGSFENFKPRSLAMEEVNSRGGRSVGSITGSVTHLLAGEGAGSKLSKAQKMGIEVVTEEEFLKLIGQDRGAGK